MTQTFSVQQNLTAGLHQTVMPAGFLTWQLGISLIKIKIRFAVTLFGGGVASVDRGSRFSGSIRMRRQATNLED
jgi:hypothetical protein